MKSEHPYTARHVLQRFAGNIRGMLRHVRLRSTWTIIYLVLALILCGEMILVAILYSQPVAPANTGTGVQGQSTICYQGTVGCQDPAPEPDTSNTQTSAPQPTETQAPEPQPAEPEPTPAPVPATPTKPAKKKRRHIDYRAEWF